VRGALRSGRLVATATALALLAACGGGTGAPGTGNADGTAMIGNCQPQNPLIPANTNEVCGGSVLDYIFTMLERYNPSTGAPEPAAAQAITSTDSQHFDVTLHPGMTFTDGSPVTAKSFVDAWNWAAYGPNGALLADPFFDPIQGFADVHPSAPAGAPEGAPAPAPAATTMSGLKVISDTEFTITLSAPSAAFLTSLGSSTFAPLPEAFYKDKKAFGRTPIGNGPYKVDSWTDNESIKMSLNDTYFDKAHAGKVRNVTYKIYQDQGAEYADLQADNVDYQQRIPTSALAGDKYKTDLAGRFQINPVLIYQSMTFPLYLPQFTNVDFRRAISLAIDRQTITQKIFYNSRHPATAYTVPSLPGYDAGACADWCTFNPDLAKSELAKAGGFTGPLTIGYNADSDHKSWVDAVCNSIKNTLGIACNGAATPTFAAFRTQVTAKQATGIYRSGWQYDYPSIQDGLEPMFASNASSNNSGYSDPAVDAALATASQATDPGRAAALYAAAEKLVLADMPVVPLWYETQQSGFSSKVDNVKINVFGELDITLLTLK
jgi:oligopeptide transport system substrate-binding protein